MAARGTRSQYTQPPNGSFSGIPSASTIARDAPDADNPRSVAPCAVGLAVFDDVRRNKLNPGVVLSASSSAVDADSDRSDEDRTLVAAAGSGTLTSPRVAVTTTRSSMEICWSVTAMSALGSWMVPSHV